MADTGVDISIELIDNFSKNFAKIAGSIERLDRRQQRAAQKQSQRLRKMPAEFKKAFNDIPIRKMESAVNDLTSEYADYILALRRGEVTVEGTLDQYERYQRQIRRLNTAVKDLSGLKAREEAEKRAEKNIEKQARVRERVQREIEKNQREALKALEAQKTEEERLEREAVRNIEKQARARERVQRQIERNHRELEKAFREQSRQEERAAREAARAVKEAQKEKDLAIKKMVARYYLLSNVTRTVYRWTNSLVETMRRLGEIMIRYAVRAFERLGQALKTSGEFILENTIKFNSFRLRLQALNKDVAQTAQEFALLRKEAAASPLTTEEYVESFTRLKAVGIDAAQEVVKELGQVAAVTGRDLRDVVASFISLEAETLRRLGIMIDRTGKFAIIESGNIVKVVEKDTATVRKAIREVYAERFPDAFKFLSQSLSAQLKIFTSNLQDLAFQFGDLSFSAGLTDYLVFLNQQLESTRSAVSSLASVAKEDIGEAVKILFTNLDRIAKKFFGSEQGKKLVQNAEDTAKEIIKTFALVVINGFRLIGLSAGTALKVGIRAALADVVIETQIAINKLAEAGALRSPITGKKILGGPLSGLANKDISQLLELKEKVSKGFTTNSPAVIAESERSGIPRAKAIGVVQKQYEQMFFGLEAKLRNSISEKLGLGGVKENQQKIDLMIKRLQHEGVAALKDVGVQGGKALVQGAKTVVEGAAGYKSFSESKLGKSVFGQAGKNITRDSLEARVGNIFDMAKRFYDSGGLTGPVVLDIEFIKETAKMVKEVGGNAERLLNLFPKEIFQKGFNQEANLAAARAQAKATNPKLLGEFNRGKFGTNFLDRLLRNRDLEQFMLANITNVPGFDKMMSRGDKGAVLEAMLGDKNLGPQLAPKVAEAFAEGIQKGFQTGSDALQKNPQLLKEIGKKAGEVFLREFSDPKKLLKVMQDNRESLKNVSTDLKSYDEVMRSITESYAALVIDGSVLVGQAKELNNTTQQGFGKALVNAIKESSNSAEEAFGKLTNLKQTIRELVRSDFFGPELINQQLQALANRKGIDFDQLKKLYRENFKLTPEIIFENPEQLYRKAREVGLKMGKSIKEGLERTVGKGRNLEDLQKESAKKNKFESRLEVGALIGPKIKEGSGIFLEGKEISLVDAYNRFFETFTPGVQQNILKAVDRSIKDLSINELAQAKKRIEEGETFNDALKRLKELRSETEEILFDFIDFNDNLKTTGEQAAEGLAESNEALRLFGKGFDFGKDASGEGFNLSVAALEKAYKSLGEKIRSIKEAGGKVSDQLVELRDKIGAQREKLIASGASDFKYKQGASSSIFGTGTPSQAPGSVEGQTVRNEVDLLNNSFVNLLNTLNSVKLAFDSFSGSYIKNIGKMILSSLSLKGTFITPQSFQQNPQQGDDAPNQLPRFAKGGIATSPSIAGEAGPEAIVPLPGNRKIPVQFKNGQYGGGQAVNVNINYQISALDSAGVEQILASNSDTVGQAVVSAMGRNPNLRDQIRGNTGRV